VLPIAKAVVAGEDEEDPESAAPQLIQSAPSVMSANGRIDPT
jgi:hypothetical protein